MTANIRHSSESNEHYTPEWIIELARSVMGSIDLDPATSAIANMNVKAPTYYSLEGGSDGLKGDWRTYANSPANVWVNPPGGKTANKSNLKLFWQKLLSEVDQGHVRQACFLCFSVEAAQTTQTSEKSILDYPVLWFPKRVRYLKPDGSVGSSPPHSSCLVYVPGLVDNSSEFYRQASQLGKVTSPYRVRPSVDEIRRAYLHEVLAGVGL